MQCLGRLTWHGLLQVAAAKGLAEDEASRLRALLSVTAAGEGVPERGLHLLKTYEQRLASAQHRLAMQAAPIRMPHCSSSCQAPSSASRSCGPCPFVLNADCMLAACGQAGSEDTCGMLGMLMLSTVQQQQGLLCSMCSRPGPSLQPQVRLTLPEGWLIRAMCTDAASPAAAGVCCRAPRSGRCRQSSCRGRPEQGQRSSARQAAM